MQIKNLSRRWGGFRLQGIDLEVGEGEYFVLLGSIGAGKTLLLESIAGLHRLEEGQIEIEQEDITGSPPEDRPIGLVYQRSMLFPHMSVFENIRFGLRFRNMTVMEQAERIEPLVAILEIGDLLSRLPSGLSGGEMQKVALARALVILPKVLLLDEPLSPLDQLTRGRIREQLKNLHKQLGTTTIEVTHDQASARIMSDRVGIIDEGSLLQSGTFDEILKAPKSLFVAEFLGAGNLFRGEAQVSGNVCRVKLNGGIEVVAKSKAQGPVGIYIHPENIEVDRGESDGNTVQGRLTEIVEQDSMIYLAIDSGGLPWKSAVKPERFRESDLIVGTQIQFLFAPEMVQVFPENARTTSEPAMATE